MNKEFDIYWQKKTNIKEFNKFWNYNKVTRKELIEWIKEYTKDQNWDNGNTLDILSQFSKYIHWEVEYHSNHIIEHKDVNMKQNYWYDNYVDGKWKNAENIRLEFDTSSFNKYELACIYFDLWETKWEDIYEKD